MKNTKKALVVALSCVLVLCVALTFVVVPTSNAESGYTANWGTHELVQQADYNLRDGATESQFISYGPSAGSNVWYSRSVANYYDLSKVTVLTSYKGYDTLLKQGTYSSSTVKEQIDFVTNNYGWDVLGAINGTSFNTGNGAPNMGLMIDGVEYSDTNYPHGFFGIMYDSEGNQKAVIGKPSEVRAFFDHQRGETLTRTEGGVEVDYTDFQMKHAIGGWWPETLVYDSVVCAPGTWDEEHPRTAIGIKADGTVVTYVCEGRNQGRAGGMSLYTMATIMKDLGCVYAINLDGGGSSTALSRHEGETTYSNRIEAAYGADRSVGDAILFVSTESYADRDPATTPDHDHTFVRAQILPNQDLFISGTTVNFTATGSDAYGDPVALPEGLTWKLDEAQSTAGIGSVDPQTGVFTATHGATGNAVVNLCQGETVVGSTKVSFAWPDWTYSNNWTREFSIGLNEEQLMYFVLYPSNNELNKSFGISTWRPFVIQECDFTWNLPSDCSVEIRNNFCYFKAGSSVVADFTVSIAKINGTGQTTGAFTNLKALVNVGKAPEMLYDFEDADWLLDIGRGGNSSTNIYRATAEEGGKVLFGEASMAIDYDFSARNYIPNLIPGKSNNGTINWYNDNRGYNPVIPADASYFGFWMWVPEGLDGCWLRATLEGSDGRTNRTIMTDFVEMPKNPKVDKGTVSGNWRFYYGRLGVDISTNSAWTITGPYSIYYVQIMWSAFADTMLGYEYNQADTPEAKEAARAEIEAKFNNASRGTIYVDNVMAMYGEPTSDMFAPYVSEMNVANTESGSSVTFKLSDENRYDTSTLSAIKYGEVQTLGDLLTVSGVNYSTLELYLNGSRIPAEQISVNEETGIVTVSGLSTIGYNDSLRFVAYDNSYNKLDKTITLRKIAFTSGVATESDVATTVEHLFWTGDKVTGVEAPAPATVDHDGYYFVEWQGEVPAIMPDSDVVITAVYSNLYKLTITEQGATEPLFSENVAYGSEIRLPERTGYTASWVTEGVPSTMPAAETNLVVKFTINNYQLAFKVDGEAYGEPQSVEYGTPITLPSSNREGYSITWQNAVGTMPANDLTIEGAFTINQYKVTYKQGEKVVAEKTQDYNSDIELPTITGYDVIWKNAETRPTKVPARDVEVEVVLIAHQHMLMIKENDDILVAQSVAYGSAIEIPQREGYEFIWVSPAEPVATMPDNDLTIVGFYRYAMYKVTFVQGEDENKQVVAEKEFLYGTAISLPTITGYDVAWKDANQVPEVMPPQAIELEVVLTAHKHHLTIKEGEEVLFEEDVDFGTVLPIPARTGYRAVWVEPEVAIETMPDEALTVIVRYEPIKYTITYIVENQVFDTVSVAYGSEITLIDGPERYGYTFAWDSTDVPETMPAHDIEITGAHTVNTHTLTFTVDGEPYGEPQTVAYGTTITLPEVEERTGYTFGWTNAVETMPDNDLTVTGVYTAKTYTLTFTVDGETHSSLTVTYGEAITLPTVENRTGYTFGWTNAVDTMPANDLTIAGVYTVNSYALTFTVDGIPYGSVQTVEYGAAITLPTVENKTGYTFGWTNAVDTMPAENLTIAGVYTLNSYTLTFVVEGEQYGAPQTVEYGAIITFPTVDDRTGHTFAWTNPVDTMPASDLTIEGAYTANVYTVSFVVDNQPYETETFAYGETIVLPAVDNKLGYVFAWASHSETMTDGNLEISGWYSVDVAYVTEKVSAVANATSVEERFAAIKAANAAIAIYTEADKAEISDIIAQLENLKTQYTETASKANADLTVANKVLSALMSALVELTLAAAVTVIIKRRLF